MDFSRYYESSTKQSLEEDGIRIASGFQDIIKRGARVSLRLVNYYKGLPLSYPATLVEIDRGTLELDVHQQQAVALNTSRYTFIKCDYFDCPILAEVQSADVRRMTASLRNFMFVEIMAERRSALRLEMEPQTDAEIKVEEILLTGKVIDVSLGGFSIRPAQRCTLLRNAEVTLRVMVPNLLQNTLTRLETKATHIETVSSNDHDICRFSISTEPQSEGLLSRFIFQRQVEIIRELKEQS